MSSKTNMYHYGLVGVLFLMLFVLLCVVTSNDFTITPSNPVVGSVVTVSGTTLPNASVNAQVSYEKILPVSGGSYQLLLQKIVIPSGNNALTVKTTGVQSMSVGLKQSIWTTVTAKTVNGVATVSQSNVAAGTYDTIIYGKSASPSVVLDVTASKVLTADSNGNYVFSYNSAGMPTGVYTVKIGSVTKSFILK